MKTKSLARQTVTRILMAQLLCALTFMTAALFHERRARLHAFDVMLQGRSDSLFGAVQDAEDSGDNLTLNSNELHFPSTDVYAVYLPDRSLLGHSSTAPSTLLAMEKDGLTNRRFNGRSYRILQREYVRVLDQAENGGKGIRRPVTVVYASPDGHIWHGVLEAASFYISIAALLLLLTAGFTIMLMRTILRPIRELGQEASAVNARSLQFTAPDSALQIEELRPLATALSAMVDGLNTSFQQQHRFVGDAAHELKTAVAVTHSSIQLLLLRPRSREEYVSGLHELLQDNDRVEELVARMLTLARLEERTASAQVCSDLAATAQAVLHRMRSFAEVRGVKTEMTSSASAPVPVSQHELEMLLSNLLGNAVQHSSPGQTVRIEITTMPQSALLQVHDQGEGISAEALPHVFERFYREDSSRSRETGGAGLGLAICKLIVDTARGRIEIASVPGRETTVSVTLPLAHVNLQPALT